MQLRMAHVSQTFDLSKLVAGQRLMLSIQMEIVILRDTLYYQKFLLHATLEFLGLMEEELGLDQENINMEY